MKKGIVENVTDRIMRRLNETLSDDMSNGNIRNRLGRKPKTIKARINQIYKIVHEYRIDSRKYHDDHWAALDDYNSVISSLGGELSYWCTNGGYTDRDPQDGMPRSKVYDITITYDDGMVIAGYIKMMAAGSMEDPFDAYDTCIILWPKK